eukprot:403376979
MEKEGFIPLGQCGQGSYGKVMMAVSTNTHKPLAIKIVKREDMAQVEREIMIKLTMSNYIGFPCIYNMNSVNPEFKEIPQEQILITDLLGSSLSWYSRTKPLTVVQVYNVGIQLLQRIRDFHQIGYVHGDIKPCNVLVGKYNAASMIKYKSMSKKSNEKSMTRKSDTQLNKITTKLLLKNSSNNQQQLLLNQHEQTLYLIDFGISTPFLDAHGQHVQQKVLRNIRCSPQYAGLNQINGMTLCRKDDIEGIFFTLISLLKVRTSKISNYNKKPNQDVELMKLLSSIKDEKQIESQKELYLIKETKRYVSEDLVRSHLPDGFAQFFRHIQSLDFTSLPDYDYLIKVLTKARDEIVNQTGENTYYLVDSDIHLNDPLFMGFNQSFSQLQLSKHKDALFIQKENKLPAHRRVSENSLPKHSYNAQPKQSQFQQVAHQQSQQVQPQLQNQQNQIQLQQLQLLQQQQLLQQLGFQHPQVQNGLTVQQQQQLLQQQQQAIQSQANNPLSPYVKVSINYNHPQLKHMKPKQFNGPSSQHNSDHQQSSDESIVPDETHNQEKLHQQHIASRPPISHPPIIQGSNSQTPYISKIRKVSRSNQRQHQQQMQIMSQQAQSIQQQISMLKRVSQSRQQEKN